MSAATARPAAEVVCAGFTGTGAVDAPLGRLKELGVRSVILFARNVVSAEQIHRLCGDVQNMLADEHPAAIAVDQEGGPVARLHDGVTDLPSMMALGATGNVELAVRAGRRLGGELRALGINVDFAPVLDLAIDEANTVIGTRSFGGDPQLVADFGAAFARGLREGGVVPVGKHFPGHGATHVDSHFALPVLDVDGATWRERDLVPFARAVRDGIPALMTAHVVLRALDAECPATRSPAILTNVLRNELRFQGAIFSDCLEMAALGMPPSQSAPLALAAGVDCVVISHHVEQAALAIEAIERSVRDGDLPEARLREAAARMRRLRESIVPAGSLQDGDAGIGLEIARAAVRVLRGSIALRPQSPVTVISFEEGERPSLSAVLRSRGHKSEIMRVGLDPRSDDVDVLEMVLSGFAARTTVIVMRRAHLHGEQRDAINRLLRVSPDAIVVSAREPYDAQAFDSARNLACIYDDGETSIAGLADVMTGRSATVC